MNHAHNTFYGMAMAKRPLKAKAKLLSAKKRKLLVAEFQKEDQEISAKALEALWKLQHFEEYPVRDKFRRIFLSNQSFYFVNT